MQKIQEKFSRRSVAGEKKIPKKRRRLTASGGIITRKRLDKRLVPDI